MVLPPTESPHPLSGRLSELEPLEVIQLMASEDPGVLLAVDQVSALLAEAARMVCQCLDRDARLVMVGAGTSGRLALQEAAEVSATFGIAPDRLPVLAAGRFAVDGIATASTEDDTEVIKDSLTGLGLRSPDVILGLSASGRAPFVQSALEWARRTHVPTICLVNDPASPFVDLADLPIVLDTGPELLTGSTRLKAGTAQKLALNRITMAAMVLLRRVEGNSMSFMTATNEKLRARATRIVMDSLELSEAAAQERLRANEWSIARATRGHADN